MTTHYTSLAFCLIGGYGVGYFGGWRVIPWFALAMIGMAL